MLRNSDSVAGFGLIVAGGAMLLAASSIGTGVISRTLTAGFFPSVCGLGVALVGAFMLFNGLRSRPAPLPALIDARVVGIGVLMLVYFLAFKWLDFRLSSWLFILVSMAVLGNRSWRQLLIVPPVTVAVIYLLFRYGFGVLLPAWV